MVLKKVMELADNRVCSFATRPSFIAEEVDLPRQSLTVNSKESTLAWSEKVDWPWLQWIAWIMDLNWNTGKVHSVSLVLLL